MFSIEEIEALLNLNTEILDFKELTEMYNQLFLLIEEIKGTERYNRLFNQLFALTYKFNCRLFKCMLNLKHGKNS